MTAGHPGDCDTPGIHWANCDATNPTSRNVACLVRLAPRAPPETTWLKWPCRVVAGAVVCLDNHTHARGYQSRANSRGRLFAASTTEKTTTKKKTTRVSCLVRPRRDGEDRGQFGVRPESVDRVGDDIVRTVRGWIVGAAQSGALAHPTSTVRVSAQHTPPRAPCHLTPRF